MNLLRGRSLFQLGLLACAFIQPHTAYEYAPVHLLSLSPHRSLDLIDPCAIYSRFSVILLLLVGEATIPRQPPIAKFQLSGH